MTDTAAAQKKKKKTRRGYATAEALTPKQREERARNAANARWSVLTAAQRSDWRRARDARAAERASE